MGGMPQRCLLRGLHCVEHCVAEMLAECPRWRAGEKPLANDAAANTEEGDRLRRLSSSARTGADVSGIREES